MVAFRHADTEVDFCFIVEDTFCPLIINFKPELLLSKDLLLIVLPSSPAIANTFVVRSWLSSNMKKLPKRTNKDLLGVLNGDHSPVGLCYCCVMSNE